MILERIFEVRVLVNGLAKMFHIDANSRGHAGKRGERYGRVLSVRKVDVSEYTRGIEFIKLEQEPLGAYLGGGLYDKDISDELLGLGKKKNRKENKK